MKAAEIYGEAKNQIAILPKDALTKMLVQQAIDQLNGVSRTVGRVKEYIASLSTAD